MTSSAEEMKSANQHRKCFVSDDEAAVNQNVQILVKQGEEHALHEVSPVFVWMVPLHVEAGTR